MDLAVVLEVVAEAMAVVVMEVVDLEVAAAVMEAG